ncbi:MAG: 16S rRNA (guanine(527)-N(7))-methyltransferase RsmG [Clostridia bacterium]|nr:16S rRNA (guanine(527)-N(7))-methyltransferase RsmG [Clostridia bacterium]
MIEIEELIEVLKTGAEQFGISLDETQTEKFAIYTDALLEYNAVMNLTSITETREIALKHYVDSLSLKESGVLKGGASVIDIGAGAGFPSLPNAIIYEDIHFTLLDSLAKRIGFLNEAVRRMGLTNVTALHSRAENAGRSAEHREKYDVACARAVAKLSVLAEYALPLVKPGGYFVAMKGTEPEAEVQEARRALKLLGGEVEEIKKICIAAGGEELNHSLIIIRKKEQTKSIYPRNAGTPSKKPL